MVWSDVQFPLSNSEIILKTCIFEHCPKTFHRVWPASTVFCRIASKAVGWGKLWRQRTKASRCRRRSSLACAATANVQSDQYARCRKTDSTLLFVECWLWTCNATSWSSVYCTVLVLHNLHLYCTFNYCRSLVTGVARERRARAPRLEEACADHSPAELKHKDY